MNDVMHELIEESVKEYVNYLMRVKSNKPGETLRRLNQLSLNREIGYSYGVTSAQMDGIDWSKYE